MCNCSNEDKPDASKGLEVLASSNGAIVTTRGHGERDTLGRASVRSAVFTDPKALGEWFAAWFLRNVPAEESR